MAEEVEMTPVEMTPVDETPIAGEPPKADPLKTAGAAPKTPTVALKPGLKLPPKPGATVTALRPGLKLPPKPGLAGGIKLPPKPGATVTALRPGLKLPPKPGATVTALRPGLKLPPKPGATVVAPKPAVTPPVASSEAAPAAAAPAAVVPETPAAPAAPVAPAPIAVAPKSAIKPPMRPMIHKPGTGPSAMSLPKPVQSVPPPVAVKSAEPVAEAPKPAEASKPAAMPVDAQGVAKLPTVTAAPVAREEVDKPETPSEQLKKVTQTLKGLTQQIPQQAILRKTGIIAEDATTTAQKEAAKHKTARISLSEAIGVAPVKNENAPMKTIRIKRPIDIPGVTAEKPALEAAPDPKAAAESSAASETSAPAAATTITQRKTLKIARPGGAVRPAGRFGVKRPGATSATTVVKKPVDGAEAPAEGAPAESPAAEIADIPSLPSIPDMPAPTAAADTTPGWLCALSALVQAAACLGVGALAWLLYQGTQTLFY